MVKLWLAVLSLLIELSFSGSELLTKGDRLCKNRELMHILCDLCTFFVALKHHELALPFTVEYRKMQKMVASVYLVGPSEGHALLIGTL